MKNQSIESGRLIDDVFFLEKGCFASNKKLERLRRVGSFIQENILVFDFQEQKFAFGPRRGGLLRGKRSGCGFRKCDPASSSRSLCDSEPL